MELKKNHDFFLMSIYKETSLLHSSKPLPQILFHFLRFLLAEAYGKAFFKSMKI